jgi:two-component system autoinducer 1 sensor kinase/phosphatase LuxN
MADKKTTSLFFAHPFDRFSDLGSTVDKVLVVDDEECMREMLALVLTELGFEVTKAKDGADALDQFQSPGGSVSLVIMDIRMPRLNGIEAAQRIKALSPATKIVLISGNDQPPVGKIADAFLPKPFRVNELCEVVNAVLGDGKLAAWMKCG